MVAKVTGANITEGPKAEQGQSRMKQEQWLLTEEKIYKVEGIH